MELCSLKNINKSFTMGEVVRPIIDLNLTLYKGELITIEGPSGTGKTTLLNLLGTLLLPDDGEYIFEGNFINKFSDKERVKFRAKEIGFLFQNTNLIQALTLKENIQFVAEEPNDKKIDEIIEDFGLSDRKDYLPYKLSGGQKRRAGACRGLVHNPKLILADEPTNDLDKEWSEKIMQRLKHETERGASVVIVTHNHNLIKYADRTYYLSEGKLKEGI